MKKKNNQKIYMHIQEKYVHENHMHKVLVDESSTIKAWKQLSMHDPGQRNTMINAN